MIVSEANLGWTAFILGIQHFKISAIFHDGIEKFYEQQETDKRKTEKAIEEGYNFIRIDYTQLNNVNFHIKQALKLKQTLYLSMPELYEYIG